MLPVVRPRAASPIPSQETEVKDENWPGWANEAAMVADFTAWAQHEGWVVYAETCSWDLLLVRPSDGFQIGVEAKMRLNADVVCQVLSRETHYQRGVGPDCWAVLVPAPKSVNGMQAICRHLSIVVIEGRAPDNYFSRTYKGPRFTPDLPSDRWSRFDDSEMGSRGWPERCPDERHPLPDYIPDVTGGHPSPVALTDWKIKAIKIAVVLERRGFVTRADFKALKIDPSRWTQFWLKFGEKGRWVSDSEPDFKAQHPINYQQIADDWDAWSTVLPPVQDTLA